MNLSSFNSYYFTLGIGIVVFAIHISGCSSSEKTNADNKSEFSVPVFITNQSGINSVHILVKLTGPNLSEYKTIADEDFEYKSGHYHKKYNLNLIEGQYHIIAESSNGNAMLDVVFTVDKPLWLIISYWGENHFQFYISQHYPIFG